LGDVGCFSFYPGKNLGAFGEAGAVVTNRVDLQARIRILRDHGQDKKYHHSMIGWTSRMDGIQAAVLRVKLRHLDEGNQRRRALAVRYDRELGRNAAITTPTRAPWVEHAYHIYAIRVEARDQLIARLAARGIGTGIHYPVAIHLQPAYAHLGYRRGALPIAEQCADEFISLPMFPELTDEMAEAVVETLEETDVVACLQPGAGPARHGFKACI
jgi:dTDP-4-amino-4,6-dideoxygalactose transaminase